MEASSIPSESLWFLHVQWISSTIHLTNKPAQLRWHHVSAFIIYPYFATNTPLKGKSILLKPKASLVTQRMTRENITSNVSQAGNNFENKTHVWRHCVLYFLLLSLYLLRSRS